MHNMVVMVNNTVLYLKFTKRLHLKVLTMPNKKKNDNYVR